MSDAETQERIVAAKLCNCAISDIEIVRRDDDGSLVVLFIWHGKRRFTPEQVAAVAADETPGATATKSDEVVVRTTAAKKRKK
jgi:hypothetical protein